MVDFHLSNDEAKHTKDLGRLACTLTNPMTSRSYWSDKSLRYLRRLELVCFFFYRYAKHAKSYKAYKKYIDSQKTKGQTKKTLPAL